MITCPARSIGVLPVLLAVWVAGCFAAAAYAQETQEPFSHIALRGSMTPNVRHNASYRHWQRGSGVTFAAATPFYFGEMETGLALHRYPSSDRDTPSFEAWFVFAGWGAGYSAPRVFSWYAGLRTGIYYMDFDEDTFPGVREESEFSLALVSRIDLHLSQTARLFVEGHVMRTYTLPRFDTAGLTGGIGLRFRSPAWLRALLE